MPVWVWITIFWCLIRESVVISYAPGIDGHQVIISVFGTLGFAEEEFWSSCLKLLVIAVFLFIGM